MKQTFNWQHLKFFLALARTCNLARAAAHVNSNPTTVFRRVKAFETEVGMRLFESEPRGYRLTPAGERLYHEAREIENHMDSMSRTLQGLDQGIEGLVVFTTTDTLAHSVCPTILGELSQAYPDIRLDLRISTQFFNLSKREADIALRPSLQVPPNLFGRKLGRFDFAIYATPAYFETVTPEFAWDRKENHRFIGLSDNLAHLTAKQWFDEVIPEERIWARADNLMMAVQLCRHGLGLTALPCWMELPFPQLIKVYEPEPFIGSDLWLLTHRDVRAIPRIKATTQFLFDAVKARLAPFF